jgi:hypothetical protein
MAQLGCSDVCEIIHDRLNALGFKIDGSNEDHTDMIEALNKTTLYRDDALPNGAELESAYTELWAAVENGTVGADFFKLRERFRNTVQKTGVEIEDKRCQCKK